MQFFRSFWLWVTKTDEKSFIIRGSAMMLRYSINKPCPFIKAQCCKIRKKCNLWKVTLQLFARPQGFFEIFSHDMSLKGMEIFFLQKNVVVVFFCTIFLILDHCERPKKYLYVWLCFLFLYWSQWSLLPTEQ